jgi:hypothetical protein
MIVLYLLPLILCRINHARASVSSGNSGEYESSFHRNKKPKKSKNN